MRHRKATNWYMKFNLHRDSGSRRQPDRYTEGYEGKIFKYRTLRPGSGLGTINIPSIFTIVHN